MTGPAFTADSALLMAGSRAIHELGRATRALATSAHFALSDTSWTGEDDYGHELRATYVKTRDSVLGTLDAVAEGVLAIGDGTIDNLGTILATQRGVMESIGQHARGGRP
ncbi:MULTISPECIES: hypothetical protein [Streptomyces]|jgi:hypothetical protein|uniref:WXG100 family type VII secretion target n=3 Tax=Streptomyces griseoaurantiacus TaxID=68213 RepID=F3NGW4_9ACTN|nr:MULTISPECIES: hypothetical protein [Streptomyces]EGG47454.1 hypothetical protein SGM_2378 [Streptomyces griseoaurantiacus M045]MBA5223764.1 hypothetical protein [Streptomyces griseoaurantiacus]MCF0088810.1 hypothetical protein [Streptomyces sp. MH192]MCF0101044.1 hypothetical protein [Streptomyces sp. MH191]MDX3092462.1 hypothetical protein [Streptomyces sp. ME12-02E]